MGLKPYWLLLFKSVCCMFITSPEERDKSCHSLKFNLSMRVLEVPLFI